MKTIYVFLAEGFEEVEALTPVDVLRRAGLPVKTVSVTGVLTVNGAHGVPVVADMVFEEVKEGDAEMIVLPGGLPGATNLDAHEGLGKLIMTFAEAGRPLSAICAAPLVYGKRGLLKGKKVPQAPVWRVVRRETLRKGSPAEWAVTEHLTSMDVLWVVAVCRCLSIMCRMRDGW